MYYIVVLYCIVLCCMCSRSRSMVGTMPFVCLFMFFTFMLIRVGRG